MRLVLANQLLCGPGGSETYLLTVADQLQRMGHDVTLYALELGDTAELAAERGLRVTADAAELPAEAEGVLVQDGVTAYTLTSRYPGAARVFVAHSNWFDLQRPPQLPDVCQAVVVLNDRVGRSCQALAVCPELVRLRQPVDLSRFGSFRSAPGSRPQRALLIGNYLGSPRFPLLAEVCRDLGVELVSVGQGTGPSREPEHDMAAVDMVFGTGRAVVEAMAAGRPAFVFGLAGVDGWVTPNSYAALEADGFAGAANGEVIDAGRLKSDLRAYSSEMGEANHDLATLHHDAEQHAITLVQLFRRLEPRLVVEGAPLEEMARLVRVQWRTEQRTVGLKQ